MPSATANRPTGQVQPCSTRVFCRASRLSSLGLSLRFRPTSSSVLTISWMVGGRAPGSGIVVGNGVVGRGTVDSGVVGSGVVGKSARSYSVVLRRGDLSTGAVAAAGIIQP